MNEQAYLERREPDWQRLQFLCAKGDATVRNLTGDEMRELVRLYRRASTDLAYVRTKSANVALAEFLNDLVGRAYSLLYKQPRTPFLATLLGLLALAAQTVRRRKVFVLISVATFFISGLFAYFIMDWVPATSDILVPPGSEKLYDSWKSGKFEERTDAQSVMMSGFYASNNPRVAIIAGAVGAGTFGFLSVYLNWQNGMMLGSLAHETHEAGTMGNMLASVSPHGVPELSGVFVAAACGMLLGWALIHPGRKSRGDSLRAVGKDAIVLLATSVVLMFIAAPIEGFFSFNPRVPNPIKVVVATIEVCAWLAFWGFYGKENPDTGASMPSKQ